MQTTAITHPHTSYRGWLLLVVTAFVAASLALALSVSLDDTHRSPAVSSPTAITQVQGSADAIEHRAGSLVVSVPGSADAIEHRTSAPAASAADTGDQGCRTVAVVKTAC
ncbi:MAG: hypothetical protein QOJ67_1902 [Acidimicrobiaceae bacterium]|jgi:hypothetical protein